MNITQLEKQIEEKQAELKRLLDEKGYLSSITPIQAAARMLAHFPRWGEGWGYELKHGFIDDWTGQYHREAYNKISDMLSRGVPIEHIMIVLDCLTK